MTIRPSNSVNMTAGSLILKSLSWPLKSKKRNRSGSGGSGDYQPESKSFSMGLSKKLSGRRLNAQVETGSESPAVRSVEFKYTWPIEGFLDQATNCKGDGLDSKSFPVNFNGVSTVWNLSTRFWKNEDGERLASPLVFCLNLLAVRGRGDVEGEEMEVEFSFGAYNRRREEHDFGTMEKASVCLTETEKLHCVGYRNIHITKDHANSRGDVIFQVRLSLTGGRDTRRLSSLDTVPLPSYLANQTRPVDGVMKAGNRKFAVHQDVLAETSPVLGSLFGMKKSGESDELNSTKLDAVNEEDDIENSETKDTLGEEKEKKVTSIQKIVMTDLVPNIAEEVLQFAYTGKVNNMNKNCEELMVTANRLQIPGLQSLCSQHLSRQIDVVNVADILLLAHRNNCHKLKKDALAFCCQNFSYIIKNSGWSEMETKIPTLWEEVLGEVAPVTCNQHTKCIKEASTRYQAEQNRISCGEWGSRELELVAASC